MKHLKSYNESKYSIPEDIKNNLFDICLELNDTGNFQISYSHFEAPEEYRYPSKDSILIRSKSFFYFRYEDIEEEIERIRDYLITEGYYIMIRFNGENSSSYYEVLPPKFQLPSELFECRIFLIERKEHKSINESKSNISRQDILEICYDITDDKGFIVNMFNSTPVDDEETSILITNKNEKFQLNDVIDVIQRLQDYLGNSLRDIFVMITKPNDHWIRYYFDEDKEDYPYIQKPLSELNSLPKNTHLSRICIYLYPALIDL